MPRLVVLAVLLLLWRLGPAQPTHDPDIEEQVERATQALEVGDRALGERLVSELAARVPHHRQVRFLQAHLALYRGDRARAIEYLRGLLSEDPTLIRVRLDLAKTLYEAGFPEAATHHFELALGSDLPPAVRHNVRSYLDLLRYAHTYLALNAFVTRDSNVNQGPAAATIYLFGLPFEVTGESRPRKATGVVVLANGRVAFGPERGSYLLMDLEQREYRDSIADYAFVRAGAGHSVLLGPWRVGAEGGYYDARFQHRALSGGPWLRTYGSVRLGPSAQGTVAWQRRRDRYSSPSLLDGRLDIASADVRYAMASSLSVAAGMSISRNSALDPLYSYRGQELRVAGVAEFPFGFVAELAAAHLKSRYDAEDPFFGTIRRDDQSRIQLSLAQRAWSIGRFAAHVQVGRVRNRSNIALNESERDTAGLGVTTRF